MASAMQVDVVSVEQLVFSGLAEFMAAPAELGDVGIYPRHTPMIVRLKPGVVRLKTPPQSGEEAIYVAGGILEVHPEGVTILSPLAMRARDYAEGKLMEEDRKVAETLKNRVTAMEYARLEVELAKAFAEILELGKLRAR